jgi:hypothetical protein
VFINKVLQGCIIFLSAKSGQKSGRLKKLFSYSALTLIVKPLTLISVIAPMGMLDLNLTLTLIPNVKWALHTQKH